VGVTPVATVGETVRASGMRNALPIPAGFRELDLLAKLASQFAVAAVEASRKAAQESAFSRRVRRGATLRPGRNTPLWNELARAVNAQFRRRGDRVNLGRILGLPRQRIYELFGRNRYLPDAERTLLLLLWLQARRAGQDLG
jgi:hypothetical protein